MTAPITLEQLAAILPHQGTGECRVEFVEVDGLRLSNIDECKKLAQMLGQTINDFHVTKIRTDIGDDSLAIYCKRCLPAQSKNI